MTRQQRRLSFLAGGLLLLGVAAAVVLTALSDGIVFFYGPKEAQERLANGSLKPGQRVRVGGLVEPGSVERGAGETVRFTVSDGVAAIRISYTGILPDLFREGQGIVAQGRFEAGGDFAALDVLAKHDETYMPPEVAEALKKSGRWKEGETGKGAP